jgi:hypothetical protein
MQAILWECTYRGKWLCSTQNVMVGTHWQPVVAAIAEALPYRYREHTWTCWHTSACCEQTPWAGVEFISPKGRLHPHRVNCRPYAFDPETGLKRYLTAAELYA